MCLLVDSAFLQESETGEGRHKHGPRQIPSYIITTHTAVVPARYRFGFWVELMKGPVNPTLPNSLWLIERPPSEERYAASPIVSAITAPRAPSGLSCPSVES